MVLFDSQKGNMYLEVMSRSLSRQGIPLASNPITGFIKLVRRMQFIPG
jgi:hypothetical protein